MVYATSAEAVASLLEAAVEEGKEELAVRIGYWDDGSRETIDAAMTRLREERGIVDEPYWAVNVYPESGQVGLVEFLLNAPAPEKEVLAAEEMPAEEAETAAQEKE